MHQLHLIPLISPKVHNLHLVLNGENDHVYTHIEKMRLLLPRPEI